MAALRPRYLSGARVLEAFGAALQQVGMCVQEQRALTAVDVANLGSSWAKRLGIPNRRPAWLLSACRLDAEDGMVRRDASELLV